MKVLHKISNAYWFSIKPVSKGNFNIDIEDNNNMNNH